MLPKKPRRSIAVAAKHSLLKCNSHLSLAKVTKKTVSKEGARQHPDHPSKLGQTAKICCDLNTAQLQANKNALLTSEVVVRQKHCLQHVHPGTKVIWDAACKLI